MDDSLLLVRVAKKTVEAQDIVSFDLVDPSGAALPPFTAGAHVDVHIHGMIRQYSLCKAPWERHRYQIAVLREANSRGGSEAMHDAVSEGDLIRISLPRNHFELGSEKGYSLLIAGGVGITPIICMAEALASRGAPFGLHYFARSEERTAFRSRLLSSAYSTCVGLHWDDQPHGKPKLSSLMAEHSLDAHLYVCGPAGFLDHVLDTARDAGWTDNRLHYEFFSAPSRQTLTSEPDGEFDVVIASTGDRYKVTAGRSIVDVLGDHGIDVPVSCGQGVCGTCVTRVVDGIPDHRDLFLTPEERGRNDQITPCCSRAKTGCLTLDL